MTPQQQETMRRLRTRVRQKLEIIDEYENYILTQNEKVGIKIGPQGGIEIPSLRHYVDAFEAAVDAPTLFRRQRDRDVNKAEGGGEHDTGHFNPGWDLRTGRCVGVLKCPRCKPKPK
jgi:hypothetical protein